MGIRPTSQFVATAASTFMTTHGPLQQSDREKRRVAASSLAAAVLLTGTKLGIGLWTNSLGILSEAAHSGLDLAAAAVTLWAVRVSSRPADREHPYGHGKSKTSRHCSRPSCCWSRASGSSARPPGGCSSTSRSS